MISGGGRCGCCPGGPQAGYDGVAFGPDLELLAGLGGKDNFAADREAGDRVDLLEPGVVSCSRWRPPLSQEGGQPAEVDEFCGVARKP